MDEPFPEKIPALILSDFPPWEQKQQELCFNGFIAGSTQNLESEDGGSHRLVSGSENP